ncbi:hypothetical protein Pelo_3560 [Pelomyxa schiedti]|nr:hypothetical protein Pelo_3560 [Pelomyxa schiedti]
MTWGSWTPATSAPSASECRQSGDEGLSRKLQFTICANQKDTPVYGLNGVQLVAVPRNTDITGILLYLQPFWGCGMPAGCGCASHECDVSILHRKVFCAWVRRKDASGMERNVLDLGKFRVEYSKKELSKIKFQFPVKKPNLLYFEDMFEKCGYSFDAQDLVVSLLSNGTTSTHETWVLPFLFFENIATILRRMNLVFLLQVSSDSNQWHCATPGKVHEMTPSGAMGPYIPTERVPELLFQTQRLTLKALSSDSPEDVGRHYTVRGDRKVVQYYCFGHTYTANDTRIILKRHKDLYRSALYDLGDHQRSNIWWEISTRGGAFVGAVSLIANIQDSPGLIEHEFDILLAPQFWNSGVAVEALGQLIMWYKTCDLLKSNCFRCTVNPQNTNCLSLIKKFDRYKSAEPTHVIKYKGDRLLYRFEVDPKDFKKKTFKDMIRQHNDIPRVPRQSRRHATSTTTTSKNTPIEENRHHNTTCNISFNPIPSSYEIPVEPSPKLKRTGANTDLRFREVVPLPIQLTIRLEDLLPQVSQSELDENDDAFQPLPLDLEVPSSIVYFSSDNNNNSSNNNYSNNNSSTESADSSAVTTPCTLITVGSAEQSTGNQDGPSPELCFPLINETPAFSPGLEWLHQISDPLHFE